MSNCNALMPLTVYSLLFLFITQGGMYKTYVDAALSYPQDKEVHLFVRILRFVFDLGVAVVSAVALISLIDMLGRYLSWVDVLYYLSRLGDYFL